MTIDLMDLKAQIERSHMKEMASHFSYEHDVYHVRILLKDNAVVTGIDFNLHLAKDKALSTAVEYGLKKGWIQEQSQIHTFTFSKALDLIKAGQRVTRQGWNGANQWLSISCPESKQIPADAFWSPHNADFARQNGGSATVAPCITLKNAQNMIVMGWIPSAGDLFADDWMVFGDE